MWLKTRTHAVSTKIHQGLTPFITKSLSITTGTRTANIPVTTQIPPTHQVYLGTTKRREKTKYAIETDQLGDSH